MLVLVDPAQQRRRIGRALQDRALDVLRERGVRSVQLGSGGFAYFWAGVPANLPGAWAFFEACGWRDEERTFDLVADLEEYTTPSGVYERPGSAGVRIHEATSADAPGIRAFAAGCFPHWLRYYEQVLDQGEYGDIVLAKDADGVTAGISYAMDFRTEAGRNDFVWQSLLGRAVGGVGPLGVAESMRGRGIGLALAARVTEMLRVRGLATSFVGYTWLVDWYGKLGYRVWREYRISRKAL
jgi:GNAT superfamily N-acetyltransferase